MPARSYKINRITSIVDKIGNIPIDEFNPSVEKPSINNGTIAEKIDGKKYGKDDKTVETEETPEEKLIKKEKFRNLMTAVCLLGVVFLSFAIFWDAAGQWRYVRFQELVLGANFSKLNVSARKDPCLHTGNSSTNPLAEKLNQAQERASKFQSYSQLINLFPAITTITLFGACTDRIGRKVFFIVPVAGYFFEMTLTWAVCYWHLKMEWLYVGSGVAGLTGGYAAIFMAMYAYTADNTDPNASRSMAMVIVGAISGIFFSISHVAVGYVIAAFGYMWPMAVGCIIALIGLLGIILFMKETLQVPKDAPPYSLLTGIKCMFSFFFIKDFSPGNKRKDFFLLTVIFLTFCLGSPWSIRTLFLLNEPFCWNSKIIGYTDTIEGIVSGILVVAIQKTLSRYLTDDKITLVCLSSNVISKLIFSFATKSWMIYVAYAIGMFNHNSMSLLRAILSKMVTNNQQGAILSSLAVLEVGVFAAAGVAFPQIYAHTVRLWKGLTFFLGSAVSIISMILLVVYIVMMKRRNRQIDDQETAKNQKINSRRPSEILQTVSDQLEQEHRLD